MKKHKVFFLALVGLIAISAASYFIITKRSQTASQKEEQKSAESIDDYLNSEPGLRQTKENIEKTNSEAIKNKDLIESPNGSFCQKAGYKYQSTPSGGPAVCTHGVD